LVLEALGVDGIRCTPLDLARAYRRLALKRIQDAQAFAPVYQGLIESIQRGTSIAAGTAASAPVYGKTGTTSQSAWFAGFSSSIALAILLFQGTGGADAAPIAGEVLAAWQNGSR
jgi:membrane carboxypeptidase/penicillin-binding protein